MHFRAICRGAVGLGIALWAVGCVLPVPHKRLHAIGVIGEVEDVRSGAPIAGAVVEAADKPEEHVMSDAKGEFVVKPVYGWHGALLVSPALWCSLFPSHDGMVPMRKITVRAAGYRTEVLTIERRWATGEMAEPEVVKLRRAR